MPTRFKIARVDDTAKTGGSKGAGEPHRSARILDAALSLFYERGFHAVSVDEIGQAAGATGAAIYRHFENKEAILAVLFDEAQDRFLVAVPPPQTDPFHRLELLVEGLVDLTLADRELGSVWANERRALSEEHTKRVYRRVRQYLDRWADCLRDVYPHRSDSELREAANAVLGMVTALTAQPGRVVLPAEARLNQRMALAALSVLELER